MDPGPAEGALQVAAGAQNILAVAPVSPGVACLCGSFGQTWLATARFDADVGGASVKVFHEARRQIDFDDASAAQRTIPPKKIGVVYCIGI